MVQATFFGKPDFSGLLRDNPMNLMIRQRVFDQDIYGEGLAPYFPKKGGTKKKIVLKDTYFEDIFGTTDDHYLDVAVTLTGKFARKNGEWTGKVDKITFKADGVFKGGINGFDGKLDVKDFFGVSPGEAWDKFSLDGFKGKLSGKSDYASLSSGDDTVNAGPGHDTVFAGMGNDVINGGAGNDSLYVSNLGGRNKLIGGPGDDILTGGENNSNILTPDALLGGPGNDQFVFGIAAEVTGGRGADSFDITNARLYDSYFISEPGTPGRYESNVGTVITDFKKAQGDMLKVDPFIVFDLPDEARYRGKKEFSGKGYFEVRMKNGVVEVDAEGDGEANSSVWLEGHGTFKGNLEAWFDLPDSVELL